MKQIPANFKNSDSVIERLVFSVNEQMGGNLPEYADDIVNHGISGGFGGFIYYDETGEFYQKNKEDIWELAIDQADQLGENALSMIASFNGAKNVEGSDQFENLMAWYAAEESARFVVERIEEEETEEQE